MRALAVTAGLEVDLSNRPEINVRETTGWTAAFVSLSANGKNFKSSWIKDFRSCLLSSNPGSNHVENVKERPRMQDQEHPWCLLALLTNSVLI